MTYIYILIIKTKCSIKYLVVFKLKQLSKDWQKIQPNANSDTLMTVYEELKRLASVQTRAAILLSWAFCAYRHRTIILVLSTILPQKSLQLF